MVYVALILYLTVVLGIGGCLHWRKRSGSLQEYTLADRRLDWMTASLSAFASAGSGLIFIGISGMAYAVGLPMLWYATGGVIWAYITFFVIGRRLRIWSEMLQSQTVTQFLGKRFQDNTVKFMASIITIVFYVAYAGAQFSASGKALVGFLNIDYTLGIWISATIIILYTMASGFWGVSLTDVFQGFLMVLAAVVMPCAGILAFGGFGPMVEAVAAQKTSLITVTGGRTLAGFFVFLLSWIGSGLMGMGNPHIIVRTMAIREPKRLVQAGILAVAVSVVIIYGAVFIGLLGRAMFPEIADQELVFPQVANSFHPLLAGIFMAAVISAIMSSADSQLILAATEVIYSFYTPYFGRHATEAQLLKVARISVLVIGGIALHLALGADKLVFWLVLFAWAGLGSAFGPLILLSLFWRKVTKWGALAGMIAGGATVFYWGLSPALKKTIYEGVPGFIAAALACILVSLLTQQKMQKNEESVQWLDERSYFIDLQDSVNATVRTATDAVSRRKGG